MDSDHRSHETETQENQTQGSVDNFALHEELGKEYARKREERGGHSIHYLVARANAPRLMLGGRQLARNKQRIRYGRRRWRGRG